jgi:hypothetical protein
MVDDEKPEPKVVTVGYTKAYINAKGYLGYRPVKHSWWRRLLRRA